MMQPELIIGLDDLENQRAMRLALESDSEKTRTIGVSTSASHCCTSLIIQWFTGVLTKPDTLSAGALSARRKWRDLIIGEDTDTTHHLRHGYYCVKLPDDAERADNPTRADRMEMESRFFMTTAPWKDVNAQGRFGVKHLVIDLSRHLTDLLDHT